MGNNTGKITKRVAPFTMMSNAAITDNNLSTAAKGLYAIIAYYTSIPNFDLYRTKLEAMLPEGDYAFRKMWNELKDNGYLIVHKTNTKSGFVYEYELLDEPSTQTAEATEPKKGRVEKQIKTLNAKKADNKGVSPSSGKSTSGLCTSGVSTSGEHTTINNNILNNTLLNNTIYNNQSIEEEPQAQNNEIDGLNETKQLRTSTVSFETIHEDIQNNSNSYDFDTYFDFAWTQVQAEDAIPLAMSYDTDAQMASSIVQECVLAMAEIYSESSKTVKVGHKHYDTLNAKQRLLKLNTYNFQGIINNFKSVAGTITNPAAYIKTMLLNGASSNGYAQSKIQAYF